MVYISIILPPYPYHSLVVRHLVALVVRGASL